MLLIFATPEEARELLGLSTRQPEIVRPQTSGPCVHCEDGTPYRCTNPYDDGQCPHLDNPEILCPVKDACYAMQEIARMRDECEAELEEQAHDMEAAAEQQRIQSPEAAAILSRIASRDADPEPEEAPVYTTPARPKGRAPPYAIRLPPPAKRKNAWTEEENWTVARVDGRGDVIKIYRAAFPDSARTDKAIVSRWERLHRDCREPLTLDTVGDTALVTQCDEDPVFVVPHPTYCPGDRVRIKHALHRGRLARFGGISPRRRTTSSRSTGCRI